MAKAKFYTSRPFISYDGPDNEDVRAEVKVVKGYGVVTEIKGSEAGKAARVTIPVDNTKFPAAGWVQVDTDLHKLLQKSMDDEIPVHFRVETFRRNGLDRKKTIDELISENASGNVFKSIAAARFEDNDDWVFNANVKTRLEEDPNASGGTSAYDHPLEKLRGSGQSSSSSSNSGNPSGSTPQWKLRNNDGSLNLGSYAVGVPAGLFSFVCEYARSQELDLSDQMKMKLSRILFKVANDLQVKIHDGKMDKPDVSDGSHVRARAMMFESVREFAPITEDVVASPEALKEWAGTLLRKSHQLWSWSIAELEKVLEDTE